MSAFSAFGDFQLTCYLIFSDLPARRLLLRVFFPPGVRILAKKPLLRFFLILLLR
jgi:hypothetical protein